jgi:tetratricopeptide (TPR) repeat protein
MTRVFCAFVLLLYSLALPAQMRTPQQIFQDAVAAQQRGDDRTAVRLYKELLQAHPEAVVARANLGASLAHLKRFDEAIEQYQAVLESDPHNLPVRVNLALAYEEKGDLPRAVSQLEFVHMNDPSNLQAPLLLSDCYFRLGRYSETVSILQPLEAKMPDDLNFEWLLGSALIQSGHPEEGLRRIDQVAEKAQSADAFLLAAQTRLGLTDYDLAKRDLVSAKRLNPGLAGLQTLNGMILERTGDYVGAETALRKALQANQEDFYAHFYLGAVLFFRREMKEARTHLEKALVSRPASAEARYELALVLRADGDLDGALNCLLEVVRENPDWLQPHIELSALYYKLHRPEDGVKERQIVDRLSVAQQGPPAGLMP